jgi:hypothetical protein
MGKRTVLEWLHLYHLSCAGNWNDTYFFMCLYCLSDYVKTCPLWPDRVRLPQWGRTERHVRAVFSKTVFKIHHYWESKYQRFQESKHQQRNPNTFQCCRILWNVLLRCPFVAFLPCLITRPEHCVTTHVNVHGPQKGFEPVIPAWSWPKIVRTSALSLPWTTLFNFPCGHGWILPVGQNPWS